MCFVLYTDVVIKGWSHCFRSEAVVLVATLSSAITQEVKFSNSPPNPDTRFIFSERLAEEENSSALFILFLRDIRGGKQFCLRSFVKRT